MATRAKPPVTRYRPSRPEIDTYWKLVSYFSVVTGEEVMALHRRLHALGFAPHRARPSTLGGKLVSPIEVRR